MRTVGPVLSRSRREHGVFDREDERAPWFQTVMHVATDEVETLHIMEGQRTDHHVEFLCGKIDVFDRQPTILDGGIVGALSGACQHLLEEIHSYHASCLLGARIAAVPAKAAAQIQHADVTSHLTVLREECSIIIFVLLHRITASSPHLTRGLSVLRRGR
jgi:hypothetical protein